MVKKGPMERRTGNEVTFTLSDIGKPHLVLDKMVVH